MGADERVNFEMRDKRRGIVRAIFLYRWISKDYDGFPNRETFLFSIVPRQSFLGGNAFCAIHQRKCASYRVGSRIFAHVQYAPILWAGWIRQIRSESAEKCNARDTRKAPLITFKGTIKPAIATMFRLREFSAPGGAIIDVARYISIT